MPALIVTANPDPNSLTAAVARAIADGARRAGSEATIADLTAEGFDPRYGAADRAAFLEGRAVPADVAREQARIDATDALVLVFPVYWWSMPAILKGWIDRVFTRDWAYSETTGKVIGLMRDRPVHLVALAAVDQDAFDRHGHAAAIDSQLARGIFGYCGRTAETTMLHGVDDGDADLIADHLRRAGALGESLASAAAARAAVPAQ